MDVFNSDAWKQQWANFMSYPYVMVPPLVIVAIAVWCFRGWQFDARLQLADKRAAWANEVRDEIIRQFKDFKEAVASGAGTDALTARISKLEAPLNALAGIFSATEGSDIANFRGTVENEEDHPRKTAMLTRTLRARDAQSEFKKADQTIMSVSKHFEEPYPSDADWRADFSIWERAMSLVDNIMREWDPSHKPFLYIPLKHFKGGVLPLPIQSNITCDAKKLYGAAWIAQCNYADRRDAIILNFYIASQLPQ
jgi:hypothetical protein